MSNIVYWTGLVAIFAVAFIAGKINARELVLEPVVISAGADGVQIVIDPSTIPIRSHR